MGLFFESSPIPLLLIIPALCMGLFLDFDAPPALGRLRQTKTGGPVPDPPPAPTLRRVSLGVQPNRTGIAEA
jgi:hypothetical protein